MLRGTILLSTAGDSLHCRVPERIHDTAHYMCMCGRSSHELCRSRCTGRTVEHSCRFALHFFSPFSPLCETLCVSRATLNTWYMLLCCNFRWRMKYQCLCVTVICVLRGSLSRPIASWQPSRSCPQLNPLDASPTLLLLQSPALKSTFTAADPPST